MSLEIWGCECSYSFKWAPANPERALESTPKIYCEEVACAAMDQWRRSDPCEWQHLQRWLAAADQGALLRLVPVCCVPALVSPSLVQCIQRDMLNLNRLHQFVQAREFERAQHPQHGAFSLVVFCGNGKDQAYGAECSLIAAE